MSEAELAKVTEEREGAAEKPEEEKPQSTEETSAAPGNTPGPDDELKELEDRAASAVGATQVKMQSIFMQVRNQIRSQVGLDFHKRGIMDVVHMMTGERPGANRTQQPGQTKEKGEEETEGEGGEKEEEQGKKCIEADSIAEFAVGEIMAVGLAALREELLASIETLRSDFKEEMALSRAEAREHTDKAVRELLAQALSQGPNPQKGRLLPGNSSGQHLPPGARTKNRQKSLSVPSLVPSLVPNRPRILSRTMTMLNPKTANAVVLGPRSKSETLGSPGGKKADVCLLEDSEFHVFATQGKKSSKPGGDLPPACPAVCSNQRLMWGRVRMGTFTTK